MATGFFCRNFQEYADKGYSHAGICVNANHMAKVLKKNNSPAYVFHVWKVDDVRKLLRKRIDIKVVVLQAIWVTGTELVSLLNEFYDRRFVIRCHSQLGFLVVQPKDFNTIREYFEIQDMFLNFTMSANNERICDYFTSVYNTKCEYLPNLYDYERPNVVIHRDPRTLDTIRIGCFGALRLLKNHITQAGAAQILARKLGCNLEFWISGGRSEHGTGVLQSLRNMFKSLVWGKLVESPWQNWSGFRKTIAHMHLLMQVSHTETYNIVSADGIAEGISSVVSPTIEWVPDYWKANPDDPDEISRVGLNLLFDPQSAADGLKNLIRYTKNSTDIWKEFIGA